MKNFTSSGAKEAESSLLTQLASEWKKSEVSHFTGQSIKQKKELSLDEKVDVYKTDQFFEKITGLSETAFFEKYKNEYVQKAQTDIQPITIGEIKAAFSKLQRKPNAEKGSLCAVIGLDVMKLVLSDKAANSVQQVASQFNGLESMTQEFVLITKYWCDRTQGPRSVMPCLEELSKRQMQTFNAFQKILSKEDLRKHIINGYVQWGNDPASFLAKIKGKSDNLQVLAMVAKPELADHTLLQVYAASVPIDCYDNSGNLNDQIEIAKELVIAQYVAIAMLAVIRAHLMGKPVTLHITFVGASAFNNPPEILNEALSQLLAIVKNEPVNVVIQAYKAYELSDYKVLKGIKTFTANEYIQGKPNTQAAIPNTQAGKPNSEGAKSSNEVFKEIGKALASNFLSRYPSVFVNSFTTWLQRINPPKPNQESKPEVKVTNKQGLKKS